MIHHFEYAKTIAHIYYFNEAPMSLISAIKCCYALIKQLALYQMIQIFVFIYDCIGTLAFAKQIICCYLFIWEILIQTTSCLFSFGIAPNTCWSKTNFEKGAIQK